MTLSLGDMSAGAAVRAAISAIGLLVAPLALADSERLADIAAAPQASQLEATVSTLVGFGTRHTLSDATSERRGIGAARRFVQQRFAAISADCGQCLGIVTPSRSITGKRIPQPTEVVDVVAVQKGTHDPDRVIVLTAHLDSINSDVMNATADAPGADDDASGVAAVLEAARILSRYRFPATIVYGVLSGEEQGLYGGEVLAGYAKSLGWRVEADLNNDIVGATRGQNGVNGNTRVRLFSEGTRANETADEARRRRLEGGEDDSPSRNVARYAKALAEHYLANWTVALVYRVDRFHRGGDHEPFNDLGFPAVRFTEAAEDYRHQHQTVRSEDGVAYGDTIDRLDFGYLAKVTATNALVAASMASAPPPPVAVKLAGAVSPDTRVSWQPAPGAAAGDRYRVWWRDTTAAAWTGFRDAGHADSLTLANMVIDDWAFGVSSVSADGDESPVVFAGAAGAFPAALQGAVPGAAAAAVPGPAPAAAPVAAPATMPAGK